jgi:hypothetical protein
VESTLAMIEARFEESILSKMDAAMLNDAVRKLLCNNAVVLIQSAYE